MDQKHPEAALPAWHQGLLGSDYACNRQLKQQQDWTALRQLELETAQMEQRRQQSLGDVARAMTYPATDFWKDSPPILTMPKITTGRKSAGDSPVRYGGYAPDPYPDPVEEEEARMYRFLRDTFEKGPSEFERLVRTAMGKEFRPMLEWAGGSPKPRAKSL